MDIPERIIDELVFIAGYGSQDGQWMPVKKYLLLSIPSEMRKMFSTRDPKTKKQSLNEFEKVVIDIYEDLTGIGLRLYEDE